MINNSGRLGKRVDDGQGILTQADKFNQAAYPIPKVTSFAITDGSYVATDDAAADTAGGQTIVVYGTGFRPGVTVMVGTTVIGSVTVLGNDRITFTSPALASGSYTIYVTNSNGGTGILVPGLVYSGLPTWSTNAGNIGSYYETTAISNTLTATGDAPITYSLSTGSLPSGATLFGNGTIIGTSPIESASTTYSFTVQATDAENQDSVRSFSITVNTDVVSWTNPSSNVSYDLSQDTLMSNVTLAATSAAGYGVTYAANALPTGVSISNGVIYGTPTVLGTNVSLLTATSATTNRSAARTITWTVNLAGDMYWKTVSLLLSANASIVTSSFVSDASLNNAQLTVVGDTRAQALNPYQTGYYSTYHSASGVYLTGSNSLFNVSSGTMAWCFEGWVYPLTSGNFFAIGSGSSYGNSITIDWGIGTANKFRFIQGNGSSNPVNFSTTNTYTANRWYHVAVTKDTSGVIRLFVNGTQDGTQTYTSAVSSGTTFVINGAYDNRGMGIEGGSFYASNYRFVINQPVYTANFTPSTTPLKAISGTALLTCQSNRLIDNSPNNFAITKTGSVTAVPANPFDTVYDYGTTYYSTYFDGTGDYLTATITALGSSDWTIEAWVYPTRSATEEIPIGCGPGASGSWELFLSYPGYSSKVRFNIYGDTNVYVSSTTYNANAWNHIAVVRSGSNITVYLNGVGGTSTAINPSYNNSTVTGLVIGRGYTDSTSGSFIGSVSNARITKGQALYTTTFTPSTEPLTTTSQGATASNVSLLTCQNATLVDNSTNAFAITSNGQAQPWPVSPFTTTNYTTASTTIPTLGSGYFDGTGDYVSGPTSTSTLWLGSGNFTVEYWMYLPANPGSGAYYTHFSYGGTGNVIRVFNTGSVSKIEVFVGTSVVLNPTWPTTAQWNHIAIVRNSGTMYIYINGVQSGSASNSTDFNTGTLTIGSEGAGSYTLGYISNFRVVKGTALYTANFFPVQTPLTAVTNTQLLTLQYNGGSNNSQFQDTSNFQNLITRGGNATQGTFSPFSATGWSGYFDGTGDYLSLPSTSGAFNFGTGDFTIEAWIYPTVVSGYCEIAGSNYSASGGALYINGGTLSFYTSGNNANTPANSILVNTWQHVAVVRSGTTLKNYINGTLQGNATSFTTSLTSLTGTIGANPVTTNSEYFTGYISNLRVAKQAIYTANFTPSTAPLTTTSQSATAGNVSLLTLQSPQFIDNSANRFTISVNGDTKIQSFSPFSGVTVTPYYSNYFDGTGDNLSMSNTSQAVLNVTTGATFTIEAWVNLQSLAAIRAILGDNVPGNATAYWGFEITTGGYLKFWWYSGSQIACTATTTAMVVGTWYHVAVVANAGALSLYVNGTQQSLSGTTTLGAPAGNVGSITIGQYGSPATSMLGYISNLRITKSQALYTTTFTPSTAPLTTTSQGATNGNVSLLTCQNSTMINNSSNALTLTVGGDTKPTTIAPFAANITTGVSYTTGVNGGSMYFDGSGDYLYLPTGSANFLSQCTANWTIECWAYYTAVSPMEIISTASSSSTIGILLTLNYSSLNEIDMQIFRGSVGNFYTVKTGSVLTPNAWNHIVITFTFSGTTFSMYVNGIKQTLTTTGTATFSASAATNQPTVGCYAPVGGYYFKGYISNLRLFNGSVLYTSSFVPPTAPPTSTASTSLLLNGTAGSIIDYTGKNNLETVGDAKLAPQNPYGGSYYSNYFDGSYDYLTIPSSASLGFGTGDFTIEAWVYLASSGAANGYILFDMRSAGGTEVRPSIQLNSSGTVYYWTQATNKITGGTLTTGQWTHLAVTRASGSTKLFLNGTQSGSTYSDSTDYGSTNRMVIGNTADFPASYNASWNGYVSNFRVVKGQALYTGTFTPSTTPLTTTSQSATASNVSLLTCQSNTIKDNSNNAFTITRNGNTAVNSTNPFQNNGTYSMYFDGTGDYLISRNNPDLQLGAGNFTAEMWLYVPALPGNYKRIFSISNSTISTGADEGFLFEISNANRMTTTVNSGSTAYTVTDTTDIVAGIWEHWAAVRTGGTLTLYRNGVAVASNATLGTLACNFTSSFVTLIGRWGSNTGRDFNGYMADLRITSGYARYTTTFTPPTTALITK